MIGVTLIIISVLIVAIWVVIEVKRLQHKLFAIFLIGLILFIYLSGFFVFKGQDIEFTSIEGVMNASKLYLSWMGTVWENTVTIVGNAIQLDWAGNTS